MLSSLYLYATALFGHWWPLVSAGSLLGIEEFAERYWSWARERLAKVPDRWRGRTKAGALILAALYSGYLAWSDEHSARLAAEARLTAGKNSEQQAQIDLLTHELAELRAAQDDQARVRRLKDPEKAAIAEACGKITELKGKVIVWAAYGSEPTDYANDFSKLFVSIGLYNVWNLWNPPGYGNSPDPVIGNVSAGKGLFIGVSTTSYKEGDKLQGPASMLQDCLQRAGFPTKPETFSPTMPDFLALVVGER